MVYMYVCVFGAVCMHDVVCVWCSVYVWCSVCIHPSFPTETRAQFLMGDDKEGGGGLGGAVLCLPVHQRPAAGSQMGSSVLVLCESVSCECTVVIHVYVKLPAAKFKGFPTH